MEITELYQLYRSHPVITTDSRNCPEGSIFVALKGASFDGNRYAAQALEKGCAYAVVDEKEYAVEGDPRYITVDDCLVTLKCLAREHRRQFDIPVVGITGTNGKTTTKELLSAVLAERYRVMHTEGNFNNDVGVPKTLLRLQPDHEIAVVEMGASHPGDIEKLVDYVEPTCGLITNVGRAHLQGFGSFEGVKRTKGELYDWLSAHGCLAFVNADNGHLMQMADERNFGRLVTYGHDEESDVWGEVIDCAPFLRLRWRTQSTEWHEVRTHLIGAYNLDNMLAAIAVGLHFDVPAAAIDHALEHYVPSNNRSQLETTPYNHLVVDAYNANPSSMAAAIENFRLMEVPGKMAILGDMGELGEVSHEEHCRVVQLLADAGLTDVWLVGKEFAAVDSPYRKFADVEEVKAAIAECRPEGHYILIKGSNSTHLYELPGLL